jgi:hypothetical protein
MMELIIKWIKVTVLNIVTITSLQAEDKQWKSVLVALLLDRHLHFLIAFNLSIN